MPVPVGVETVTINLVPPDGVSAVGMTVEAASTIPVKWGADNTPIADMISLGSGFSVVVPAVDQTGFVTPSGHPFKGWEYVITVSGVLAGRRFSENKLVKVYSTQTVVDLDVLSAPESASDEKGQVGDRSFYAQFARNPDQIVVGNIVYNGDGATTSASVVWPDGTPGTFTSLVLSTAVPGAVDSYQITYGDPAVVTYVQPTVTRDATTGKITVHPAITVI